MGWLTRAQAAALSEEERIDYLTRTVLGEAVGEDYVGMLGVAQVIHNRTQDGRFPADPVAVAGQSWQFSTNSPSVGGNQGMVSRNYGPGTPEYRKAEAAVRAAIYEQSAPDITGGAVQYHTVAMGYPASWPSSIKRHGYVDVGAHRYYPTRPVPPGEIPGLISGLKYVDGPVGSIRSVNDRGVQPIRPATMSGEVRLKRELNRIADQRANATETIRRSRAFAFNDTIDPFEGPTRSSVKVVTNRPIPAMKESMQRQIRATGTPMTTERTFAQMVSQSEGMDAPGVTLVSKPRVVQQTPWGVRERVAAVVAATDAEAGRGQLTMTGNSNISGAVVDWLYPRIAEGQGEANQIGKGNRATPPSGIDRTAQPRPQPGQSIIERGTPIVIARPNQPAQVVPQAQIERNTNVVDASIRRANEANKPELATSLAASIAARKVAPKPAVTPATQRTAADVRLMREADQSASTTTAKPAITADNQRAAADLATMRQANQAAGNAVKTPVASSSVTGKNEARLPKWQGFPQVEVAYAPTTLPKLPPAKTAPIGTMPRFSDLNLLRRPVEERIAPAPAPASQREIARGSSLFGQPEAPLGTGLPKPQLATVEMPRPRPQKAPAPAAPKVSTTAPTPASVDDRNAARNRVATTAVAPAVAPAGRPGLKVVVQRDRRPAPVKAAAPVPQQSAGYGSQSPQSDLHERITSGNLWAAHETRGSSGSSISSI